MKQQQDEEQKLDAPVRAAFKNEQPRRSHRNLTKYWLDHEADYYAIDEFFDD